MLMDARAVQHEITATDADPGGRVRTLWDCDLHRDTRVDGLPLDGMQEVWGSNPHSSTGQRHISKTWAASTAGKYRSGKRLRCRTPVRIGPLSRLVLLAGPEDPGSWTDAAKPLNWANTLCPSVL